MTTRREFLILLGTLSAAACRVTGATNSVGQVPLRDDPQDSAVGDEMDEGLSLLAPYGASFRGGLSNHGPMTAEALVSLGREDAIVPWVSQYRRRLTLRPAPRIRIDKTGWESSLGASSRVGDWDLFFKNELANSSWQDVLRTWIPRLAPGMAAAGFHCVIRVGHAVSSLEASENNLRRDELAQALAYWASEFMPLPGVYSETGSLAPSSTLELIELLPDDRRRSRGLITTELKDLVGFGPFLETINLVDPSTGEPNFMSELLATFAGVFANTRSNTFEFLHAVTGAAAVAELLPYIEPSQSPAIQAYTWQVTAGIYARFGRQGLTSQVARKASQLDFDRMSQVAVRSGDEHTIKLTAACRREWKRNLDPRFLLAASRLNRL